MLTVTRRGGVTLPAEMREALGLKPHDVLIAEKRRDGILLRPAVTIPVETFSPKRVREFDEAEAALAKVLSRKKANRGR